LRHNSRVLHVTSYRAPVRLSLLPPPPTSTPPSVYLPSPYLRSMCSMYTRQSASKAVHIIHISTATNSSSISSHLRNVAPCPVVERAELFVVHSWQSAPEAGDGFAGPIPSDMWVSVGPVERHDALHRVNVFPDRQSFKQTRVCRFVVCIDTHSKTDLC
jgi:hypothetical protein